MNFEEDIGNCADLVRRGDHDRFLAIMAEKSAIAVNVPTVFFKKRQCLYLALD